MGELAIFPAPGGFGSYVELGAHPQATGRVFRKHILTLGQPLHYKGRTFNLDDAWYGRLKQNFDARVSMTQVPLAGERNQHSEHPMDNTGEIIGLEREGNKVYDVIDVRDPEVAKRIADKRIMGASAFLHLDYTDTRTDAKVGPALLHHCLTNRPHVLDLEPYEEVIAATADMEWEDTEALVLAQEDSMTREEMLAALKAEHGIDVAALQTAAQAGTSAAALTQQIAEALKGSGMVALAGEGIDAETITGAIVELAATTRAQGTEITSLRRERAEARVDGFVSSGRLLPKSKDRAVEMLLSGDDAGLEDFLAPVSEPYVKLSHQAGIDPSGDNLRQEQDVDAEIVRLTEEHDKLFERGSDRRGSVRR